MERATGKALERLLTEVIPHTSSSITDDETCKLSDNEEDEWTRVTPINVMNLPNELLHHIFSFLSYDEVSKQREVCQGFNRVCGDVLNKGYLKLDRQHEKLQKDVKAHLPRRESERRTHFLAKHINVLSALETRFSLLNMTYMKYIDTNACCFIPGKVLDEIKKVMTTLRDLSKQPSSCHELMQELRDISSMAMEHFEDNIAPRLNRSKKCLENAVERLLNFSLPLPTSSLTPNAGPNTCTLPSFPTNHDIFSNDELPVRKPHFRHELSSLKKTVQNCCCNLTACKKELEGVKNGIHNKLPDLEKRCKSSEKVVAKLKKMNYALRKKTKEQSQMMQELDSKVKELSSTVLVLQQALNIGKNELLGANQSTDNEIPVVGRTRKRRANNDQVSENIGVEKKKARISIPDTPTKKKKAV